MKRYPKVRIVVYAFCLATVSCTCIGENYQPEDIPQWLVDGTWACNQAQLKLANPLWDSVSRRPKDKELDWLEISRSSSASYYVLSIAYRTPYPDAPNSLCHVSTLTNKVLYAEYWVGFESQPLKRKRIQFEEYEKISEFDFGSIDNWGISFATVLSRKPGAP